MTRYRAAIVGCGRIASGFAADKKRKGIVTHAQAYLAHPRVDLVAACDLDEKKLRLFGRQWGVPRLYTDFKEMLRKEKIDLLSVCTWNDSHARLVETALGNDVRGIICEKPIADSISGAERMIEACESKNVPLLLNYTRRYVGLYHRVRTLIERGDLGDVQGVSCYYGAGVMNTGSHLFDFLRFFFGDAAWVWADPNTVIGGGDPSYNGYLYFHRGFGCTLTALDVRHYLVFEADIYGTKGRIRLIDSGSMADVWRTAQHPLFSGYRTLKKARRLSGNLGEGMRNLVDNLVRTLEGRARPHCSGRDGRASLEIALALHQSAKANGARVSLPLGRKDVALVSK